MRRADWRRWAVDVGLLLLAAVDAWIDADVADPMELVCGIVAILALLLRRRYPIVVFVLTLPGLFVLQSLVASLIGLFTVARYKSDRRLIGACTLVLGVGYLLPWQSFDFSSAGRNTTILAVIYATMTAVAPALLGQLAQTRHDLSLRLIEITRSRQHERQLILETLLAKERAQLAREMHDVVSHQVSLIAVRAGALKISATTPDATEAATTIRRLSVQTLDELRHMVALLRASGTRKTELAPQPTLADLDHLIATSGIAVDTAGSLPDGLEPPIQRTIYRTIQEALTNIRKHAPGAEATVQLGSTPTTLTVTIDNTAPTRSTILLPGARHGLIGLQERAELLGGTVATGPTASGGYRVHLELPYRR